ncbi:MAG: hypothetical protein Q9168_004383 [Polycauliona sp. 1 TL-2023]
MAVTLDGITADSTAGIGAECESPLFYFENPACNEPDTFAARKQIINGRTGTHWQLTADTGQQGKVNAEYILDGQKIKVGNGDAAKTGKAVAEDLIEWKPWTGGGTQTVHIANNKCNPWRISGPSKRSKPEDIQWSPQITAPIPLEALYSLMTEHQADPDIKDRNILNGFDSPSRGFTPVVATKAYFQSNPNGIEASKVTDDVLAFCSLVLSYAKAASIKLPPNGSPKLYSSFTPRTEFNTLYKQVKSKLPGDLFPLLNSLACYKTDKDRVVVDKAYCSGPDTAPKPNNKFGALSYTNFDTTVNIKEWIEGIGKGNPSPDKLTEFDKSVDGSIGGLGSSLEKMYNSQRSVPLFEFRDLLECSTADMGNTPGIETFMSKVDTAIQELHKKFAVAPKRKRDGPTACTVPGGAAESSSPATTSKPAKTPSKTPAPIVVAPVNPPSQPDCVPKPTGHVKDSHETELKRVAAYFCAQYATGSVAKAPTTIAHTVSAKSYQIGGVYGDTASDYDPKIGNRDDVYDITVTSVANCHPDGGFNLGTPVPNNKCADILYSAWEGCTVLLYYAVRPQVLCALVVSIPANESTTATTLRHLE